MRFLIMILAVAMTATTAFAERREITGDEKIKVMAALDMTLKSGPNYDCLQPDDVSEPNFTLSGMNLHLSLFVFPFTPDLFFDDSQGEAFFQMLEQGDLGANDIRFYLNPTKSQIPKIVSAPSKMVKVNEGSLTNPDLQMVLKPLPVMTCTSRK